MTERVITKAAEQSGRVAVADKCVRDLSRALLEKGFRAVDEFDLFVTFARYNDPLKIHVGPDGSFAVFNGADELITEGEGTVYLDSVLVVEPEPRSSRYR